MLDSILFSFFIMRFCMLGFVCLIIPFVVHFSLNIVVLHLPDGMEVRGYFDDAHDKGSSFSELYLLQNSLLYSHNC